MKPFKVIPKFEGIDPKTIPDSCRGIEQGGPRKKLWRKRYMEEKRYVDVVCAVLRETASLTQALQVAKVAAYVLKEARTNDKEVEKRVVEAMLAGRQKIADTVEAKFVARATHGTKERVVNSGRAIFLWFDETGKEVPAPENPAEAQAIGWTFKPLYKREYDARRELAALKAFRPEFYRDTNSAPETAGRGVLDNIAINISDPNFVNIALGAAENEAFQSSYAHRRKAVGVLAGDDGKSAGTEEILHSTPHLLPQPEAGGPDSGPDQAADGPDAAKARQERDLHEVAAGVDAGPAPRLADNYGELWG